MPNSVLQALRRESLDIFNRLHSIAEDAKTVNLAHRFYPDTPVVPNLRCGAWYTDPVISSKVSAYFKSTDGGYGISWVVFILLLVDSTRAGKRIPDALSKTVPIWCAVVNRAILRRYPHLKENNWDTALYTPPGVVSPQEHHQIELQIDTWADALFNSSFELPILPAPLRPLWITPATTTFPSIQTLDPGTPLFLSIICLSASRQSDDGRRPGGFAYIQGSGDDHELWSMGLTPAIYWRHSTELLAASRSELPGLVEALVSAGPINVKATTKSTQITSIAKVDGRMKICTVSELGSVEKEKNMAYVLITATEDASMKLRASSDCLVLKLQLASPPKTYMSQTLLPNVLLFIGKQLLQSREVCIVCGNTGEVTMEQEKVSDEGIAVLLAALVVFFDGGGKMREGVCEATMMTVLDVDKAGIRTCLEWVIACRPSVNPARATLKRLNEFLLSRGRQKASKHVKSGATGPKA